VNTDGTLTLLKPGTVRVTARSGDASSAYDVAIRPLVVKQVEITPSALHLGRGDLVTLTVKATGQGGRTINGRTVTLTSDDTRVVLPNDAQMVRALRAGATNVRASVDGVSASIPVDVVIADTTFLIDSFNGAALPVLLASDTVSWDGVKEYHEVWVEGGTLVLSGLAQLRYAVAIVYSEYNVVNEGGQVRRELRRRGSEGDHGIADVGAGGRLAMTSEYFWPLSHTADLRPNGYMLHYRIPGDDIIWNVGYKRQQ